MFEVLKNRKLQTAIGELKMTVSESSYIRLTPLWSAENVLSPFSRLYVMESGEALLRTDTQQVVMKPGHVYLVPPGLKFSYSCQDVFSKLYFHVSLIKPDGYDLLKDFGRIGQIPVEETQIAFLKAHYSGNGYLDVVQVKSILYSFLVSLMKAYDYAQEPMMVYSQCVMDTISFIRANLSDRLSGQALAERLFVSKSFLADRFRQETGVTLGQYIDDLLMAEAQWQLARTGLSVGEISEKLGFCDQFYFSRRFKQLCGITPLKYRKNSQAADHFR